MLEEFCAFSVDFGSEAVNDSFSPSLFYSFSPPLTLYLSLAICLSLSLAKEARTTVKFLTLWLVHTGWYCTCAGRHGFAGRNVRNQAYVHRTYINLRNAMYGIYGVMRGQPGIF